MCGVSKYTLTLWNASVTPPSSLFLSLSQYHSAYCPTGCQAGTEYTPLRYRQWVNENERTYVSGVRKMSDELGVGETSERLSG